MLLMFALALVPRTVNDADRVLVVRNLDSPVSCAIAADYARRRKVRSIVSVRCPDSATGADRETIPYPDYVRQIEGPVRAYLAAHRGIDFVVLTKGVPIRISGAPGWGAGNTTPSVDSTLAAVDYHRQPGAVTVRMTDGAFTGTAWANRYWNADRPFSHARFGGYLVTRIDGYTQSDAEALTTRSLAAEHAAPKGPILLDVCPGFGLGDSKAPPTPLYREPPEGGAAAMVGELNFDAWNADLRRAADMLRARARPVVLDEQGTFAGGRTGLAGYASWGSNDQRFDAAAYHSLRFAPGALAETAVSTSARTFLPTTGGQSLIADLIAQGITGVKGYTDEPLLQAVASPSILFDRYARGWTLAESFYAASRFVGWEDIVIGDPLCRPYRLARKTSKQ